MVLPLYPANDLDQGSQLLAQLGSFWFNIFGDRDVLQAQLRSVAQSQAQNYLNYLETVACVSRLTVPVFHTEYWSLLTVTQSQANATATLYGPNNLVYGPQTGSVPGRPAGTTWLYGQRNLANQLFIKLPENLVDMPITVQNLVVNPSRVYVKNIDYEIVNGYLLFRGDPFTDPLVPKRDVLDANGVKVDTEIALWVYNGQIDLKQIYSQFGYALGVMLKSSQDYKDLLNAFADMIVMGTSLKGVQQFLFALSGAPAILDPQETVQVIQNQGNTILVVTTSRVYRVPNTANLLVSLGGTYYQGDPVTDAVSITELSGANPDMSVLPVLTLSDRFLSGGYFSEISFKNHTVALEYLGTDSQNKAVVRFETSGFPGDVEQFWQNVQTNGELAGKTLAELLDTRTNPVGEPGPLNLPATVNPVEFMLQNLFANNLFIINVRPASFGANTPGLQLFRLLRRVVPPHTTFIVFMNLTPVEDLVDLGQAGGETEAGVDDYAGTFQAAETVTDQLYEISGSPGGNVATYGDVHVSAHLIALDCQ